MEVCLSLQESSYLWPHRIPIQEFRNIPIKEWDRLKKVIEQNSDKNWGELGMILHDYFGCSYDIYQEEFTFDDDSVIVNYSPDNIDRKERKVIELKFRFSGNNPAGLNELIKSETYARLLMFPESELRIYYTLLGEMDIYHAKVNPSKTKIGFQTILKNYKDLLFEYALNNPEEFSIFSEFSTLVEEAHEYLSIGDRHNLILNWFNQLYPRRVI